MIGAMSRAYSGARGAADAVAGAEAASWSRTGGAAALSGSAAWTNRAPSTVARKNEDRMLDMCRIDHLNGPIRVRIATKCHRFSEIAADGTQVAPAA